jgi:hypothetical protein
MGTTGFTQDQFLGSEFLSAVVDVFVQRYDFVLLGILLELTIYHGV